MISSKRIEEIAMANDVAESFGVAMPFGTDYVILQSGATKRQIHHWVNKGWLKPKGNGGTGNSWSWDKRELDVARLMARIKDAGMDTERAARLARLIVDNPKPDLDKRKIRLSNGIWLIVET